MAVLYSSVGHGGASGYLAAMALFSLAPESMRPAVLLMNIFVAGLVWLRLYCAHYFAWRIYLPLALAALPMAYIGGTLTLSAAVYYYIVASALLLAAWQLFRHRKLVHETVESKLLIAIPLGLALGFAAGLTGIGGGVYLSPLLLMMRWTDMRTNAGVAAAFVFTNSLAGLAGYLTTNTYWPEHIIYYVIAAVLGALIGSELAVKRLSAPRLKSLLALVLAVAAVKMIAAQ